MSHLHRQLMANAAIAADAESQHPCTPTVVAAPLTIAPKRLKAGTRLKIKAKGRARAKA